MSTSPVSQSDVHTPVGFNAIELAASLTVADLPSSLRWYRDVIGFAVDKEHERDGVLRAVALRAGQVRLLLTQDNGAKGEQRTKGEGFSLQFTTRDDIDALAAGVVARGGVLASDPADAFGARVFRVRDADGFLLVISSERTRS
ncbi:MAG: VOC family protein [Gemmatimonadaceae bacterium]|nr:VOC family protein [Gemmatimonadaceae bacterium]